MHFKLHRPLRRLCSRVRPMSNHASSERLSAAPSSSSQPAVRLYGRLEGEGPATDKGKGRADPLQSTLRPSLLTPSPPATPLSSAIEEAISTPLFASSSLVSSFEQKSPIVLPPQAHHANPSRSFAYPRLLSQLSRSTLPTASLTFAKSGSGPRHGRIASNAVYPQQGESSKSRHRDATSSALTYDAFPDLDPTTGLPLAAGSGSDDVFNPSRHLQRTITDVIHAPPQPEDFKPSFLPGIPTLPFAMPRMKLGRSKSSLDLTRSNSSRNLSTSAPNEDWTSWATGWWGGNKGKVDRMMDEDDRADTVEEEREKHRQKYRSPKHPMVFCHGLLGFDYLGPTALPALHISHWRGIREVLEANGAEVLITRVPATASIKDRAGILAETIAEKFPGRQINLIGHSMGGLDCRYLISQLEPKEFKPISLTTVSTPHRGSPFADYVIDNVIGRDRLPSLLGLIETLRLPQSGDGSAFNALETRAMKEFNADVLDRDDVKYFSWGASFDPGLLDTFRWPHSVVLAKEGPNDGLVSVNSAKWGEYRGTLLGVNHLDLVGWVNHVRYAISGWTGNPITFKPATFYLEVADYLAEQGF